MAGFLKSKSARAIGLIVCAFALLVAVAPARAAEVRPGEQVVIGEEEVIDDDLIISGQTITMNGTVTGDLVAAGQTVIINGVVEGSALLMAQKAIINGDVGGSVYTMAYSLQLGEAATAGRNLYFGGYSLDTAPGSLVTRDAFAGGYQMRHDGRVGGDLVVGLKALDLNGEVGNNLIGEITVDPNAVSPARFMPPDVAPVVPLIQPGLQVGEGSDVGGRVDVRQTVITPTVEPPVAARRVNLPDWFTNRLGEFIGLLLVGTALIFFLPRVLPALGDELQHRALPSFGWGLAIVFILVPLGLLVGLALVVLLTMFFGVVTFGELVRAILAISAGFFGFAFVAYLFTVYVLTKIIVSYWAGRFALSRVEMNADSKLTHFGYLALGLLFFEVLRAIPIFGFVLSAVVMLFGLGCILAYWVDRRRGAPVAAPKPIPAVGV